jgi:hypothetical protein
MTTFVAAIGNHHCIRFFGSPIDGPHSGTRQCLALVSLDLADAAVSDEPMFRAGAATSNITPSIGADPTVRTSKPQATHVHDELHARCLVLDDGQAKLALVVCDLRHISAEVVTNAKQIIQKTTGSRRNAY